MACTAVVAADGPAVPGSPPLAKRRRLHPVPASSSPPEADKGTAAAAAAAATTTATTAPAQRATRFSHQPDVTAAIPVPDELPAAASREHSCIDAWLAERVAQRRPAVLRDLLGRSDALQGLRSWINPSSGRDVAAALVEAAPSLPVTSFVSQAEHFYLDGTCHPRAILTTSMSTETTLLEHARASAAATGACWPNRYCVEEIDEALAAVMRLPAYSPCHTAFCGDGCGQDGDGTISAKRTSSGSGSGGSNHSRSSGDSTCTVAKRQLFVAVGRTQTQLHRDTFPNLYLCLSGHRTWELAHPASSPQLEHSPGSVSAVDPPPPSVRRARVTLRAGDAIFVPRGWWHRVDAVGEMLSRCSVAVNWYYDRSRAGDSDEPWPTT
jgi:hypothetical protein